MYQVSAAFLSALRRPHRVITKAEVYDSGSGLVQTLPIIDGEVEVDGAAGVRRACRVTLAAREWVPASSSGWLAPYGNELRLHRGIRYDDGSEEWVPLGVFGIAEANVQEGRDGLTVEVSGYDRARKVQRARFTSAYVIARGTNYADAIRDLVFSRVPQFGAGNFAFTPTSRTTPLMVLGTEADHDPWDNAQDMARSIGMELFFDVQGVCVLRPVPNPAVDPVVERYMPGEAHLLGVNRALTDERAYNHVVVTGEALADVPVRAEAKDEVATSPTYYLGDFGDVPYFFTSKMITDQGQAQEVADALLRALLGTQEQVEFPTIVNPAHDAGDVVEVVREPSAVSGLFVIDQLRVPLSVDGEMAVTTRRRVTA